MDNKKKKNYNSASSFIDLLEDIQRSGFKISKYDVLGNWAEMNDKTDLIQFILGSKAETLHRIKPKLTKSSICDQVTCTWFDWKKDSDKVIKDIQSKFKTQSLIIRSSSDEEDTWETAQAGVFESVLDVDPNNKNSLRKSVDKVFLSYKEIASNSHVLIQPYITDVKISGVIFTCDIITGAPYYTINFDDVTGLTDTITSGKSDNLRTIILFRDQNNKIKNNDIRLTKIIEATQEIEQLLGYDKLDIEFAIDKNDLLYTFQIRPIAVNHSNFKIDNKNIKNHLQKASNYFKSLQQKTSHIYGNYAIFSRMTDWNPAEIIGTRPNPLSIDLYNNLITKKIWAKQRNEFGYRDIRPAPLLYNFCEQPYVDCRASINSFIPKDLTEDCASRLVNAYLEILKNNPHLHDKLELEIVFTIWVPNFKEEAKKRFKNLNILPSDISQLEKSLKKLTANALTRLDKDILSVKILSERYYKLIDNKNHILDTIFQLIEDCKNYGTLAFAHAARAGFVAVTLLKV